MRARTYVITTLWVTSAAIGPAIGVPGDRDVVGARSGIPVHQPPRPVFGATRPGQAVHRYGVGVAGPVAEPDPVAEGAIGGPGGQGQGELHRGAGRRPRRRHGQGQAEAPGGSTLRPAHGYGAGHRRYGPGPAGEAGGANE